MDDRLIRIQNLTDYHVNDFLTCPHSFWRKHILKKDSKRFSWQDLIEHTVSQVVTEFFSMPPTARSSISILNSIEDHWNGKQDLFPSQELYHQVLGSMTNHLTTSLLLERDITCPLFTYEKLSIPVPEWDMKVTMTIPLAFWKEDSFTIKKFTVDDNPAFIHSWSLFSIFFCHHAFNQIPVKLDITNLLTGSSTTILATENDITKSKYYLELLKESMKDPSLYFNHFPRIVQ